MIGVLLLGCAASPTPGPPPVPLDLALASSDSAVQAQALRTLAVWVLAYPETACPQASRHEPLLTVLAAEVPEGDPRLHDIHAVATLCTFVDPVTALVDRARAREASFPVFRAACLRRTDELCDAWHTALVFCQGDPARVCGAGRPSCASFCEWKGCEPWCE